MTEHPHVDTGSYQSPTEKRTLTMGYAEARLLHRLVAHHHVFCQQHGAPTREHASLEDMLLYLVRPDA